MHSMLVCQDGNLCLGSIALLPGPKAVRHSLFYDYLGYLLPFRLGAAVKAAEEEADLSIS